MRLGASPRRGGRGQSEAGASCGGRGWERRAGTRAPSPQTRRRALGGAQRPGWGRGRRWPPVPGPRSQVARSDTHPPSRACWLARPLPPRPPAGPAALTGPAARQQSQRATAAAASARAFPAPAALAPPPARALPGTGALFFPQLRRITRSPRRSLAGLAERSRDAGVRASGSSAQVC